jgi:RecA-family ATPase
VSRFQGEPIPLLRWIWDPWIPWGTVTAIYGDGGTGKSLLAQQLMTASATGQPFLGYPVTRCKALGIFCEDDLDELHRRQNRINAALGLDFVDRKSMHILPRVGAENLLIILWGGCGWRLHAILHPD